MRNNIITIERVPVVGLGKATAISIKMRYGFMSIRWRRVTQYFYDFQSVDEVITNLEWFISSIKEHRP